MIIYPGIEWVACSVHIDCTWHMAYCMLQRYLYCFQGSSACSLCTSLQEECRRQSISVTLQKSTQLANSTLVEHVFRWASARQLLGQVFIP